MTLTEHKLASYEEQLEKEAKKLNITKEELVKNPDLAGFPTVLWIKQLIISRNYIATVLNVDKEPEEVVSYGRLSLIKGGKYN